MILALLLCIHLPLIQNNTYFYGSTISYVAGSFWYLEKVTKTESSDIACVTYLIGIGPNL